MSEKKEHEIAPATVRLELLSTNEFGANDLITCHFCENTSQAYNYLVDNDTDTFRCQRCRCPFALSSSTEDGRGHYARFPQPPPANGKLGYIAMATSNGPALDRPGIYARCVYCRFAYEATRINKWIADDLSALCYNCEIDAVIPTAPEKLDDIEHYRQVAAWHHQGFRRQ